jgi:uncharacterized protein (TIGR00730 family)
MKRICVYCGSCPGHSPAYKQAAVELGVFLANAGISMVYGGGDIGLMGAVADSVMAAGGEVIGVIPHHLVELEIGHRGLTQLVEVDGMHQRKSKMAELSDGFIAMPGGIGTAEELLEILTWLQLGLHGKPVGVLNTLGYFYHLIEFISHMEKEGFLKDVHRDMLLVENEPLNLVSRMRSFVPISFSKVQR